MKKLNQRGEILIATTALLIIVGVLGFAVGASGIRKFIPGFHGNENKTKQVSVTKTESRPVFVPGPDGKPVILQVTKTETSNSQLSEEQSLSLWQRLAILPRLWLFLMVLGLFFPPVAGIMGIVNRRLWSETKKIVGGVEESLQALETTPEAKTKVLTTLSKKYDGSTKALVSKIKREL
jgi:predicted PurR-regulated permease PerM